MERNAKINPFLRTRVRKLGFGAQFNVTDNDTGSGGSGGSGSDGDDSPVVGGGLNLGLISMATGALGAIGNGLADSVRDPDNYREFNGAGTTFTSYDMEKSNAKSIQDNEDQLEADKRNFAGVPIIGGIENLVSGANNWIDEKINAPLNDWLHPGRKEEREAEENRRLDAEIGSLRDQHYEEANQTLVGQNFAVGGMLDLDEELNPTVPTTSKYNTKVANNTGAWKSIQDDSDIYKDALAISKSSGVSIKDVLGTSLGEGMESEITRSGAYTTDVSPLLTQFTTIPETFAGQTLTDQKNTLTGSRSGKDIYGLEDFQVYEEGDRQPIDLPNAKELTMMHEDPYTVSGFSIGGLDRYGEESVQRELTAKGINPNLDYEPQGELNEKGDSTMSANFRNNKDVIAAQAAMFKNEELILDEQINKLGYDLTPEQRSFFTHAAFNGGRGMAVKMLKSYKEKGYLEKGVDINTLDPSSYKQVYYNVLRRSTGTAEYADGGVLDIEIGGTHEENANGGVSVGKSADGVDNLVEEGEVVWKNMVFSNRF